MRVPRVYGTRILTIETCSYPASPSTFELPGRRISWAT